MSAAITKIMMIQMAICMVVTFMCRSGCSLHPLGADSEALALRQRSYTFGGHSA